METQSSQPAVREALTTVQQFLSDSIPPLLAADSIILLIRHPPELVASEIRAWISLQFQGSGDRGSISDYIFHAIKKLDDMGRLKLVPRNTLSEYLQKLMPLAAEFCPEDERDLLFQNLEALGNEDTALAAPVAFIHRQVKNAEVSRGDLASESGRRSRRFSLLLERLQHEAAPAPVDSATRPDKQAEQVSQVIATAAANAQSSSELQELQKVLSSFGIKSGTDHVFRRLGHSLPGWVVPVRVEADAGTPLSLQNPVVEAMSQFLKLAENKRECGKRLQELLQAAIEQFNAGSLARAVTMLELADHLISESEIKPDTAAFIREDSHESLDSIGCAPALKLQKSITSFEGF
jgi:hypothetical protein